MFLEKKKFWRNGRRVKFFESTIYDIPYSGGRIELPDCFKNRRGYTKYTTRLPVEWDVHWFKNFLITRARFYFQKTRSYSTFTFSISLRLQLYTILFVCRRTWSLRSSNESKIMKKKSLLSRLKWLNLTPDWTTVTKRI